MTTFSYTAFFVLLVVFFPGCKTNQTTPATVIQVVSVDTPHSYGPTAMVRNVRQAKNGNILVASFTGVYRYDGKTFTNLTSGIPSPSFWDVLEDRRGNLWFGSRDSGVYFYDVRLNKDAGPRKTFQHFTTRDGLGSNAAMHIYEDRAGKIWFGTGGGVSCWDKGSFQNITTKDGLASNAVNTIMQDSKGKFWIGSRGYLTVYDPHAKAANASVKPFTIPSNKDGKAFHNVWGVMEDKKGYIWFGAEIVEDKRGDTFFLSYGLWRYDGRSYTKVSEKGSYALIQDKQGNIWTTGAAEPAAGAPRPRIGKVWSLTRYDQASLYSPQLNGSEIKSSGEQAFCGILEARDGNIWFGSLGGGTGVYRYDGTTIRNFVDTTAKR